MLFLQKNYKIMILNLAFNNYRSFQGRCEFTTEPTCSRAKMNNVYKVQTKAEGEKPALKVSVIFGPNGSGKSGIIKFLYGISRWIKNKDNRAGESVPLYDPFKFDEGSSLLPTDFQIEFITNGVRYRYAISFDGKSVLKETLHYYPNAKITLLYERTETEESNETHTLKFGTSVTGLKPFRVFANQLLLSKFITDTPAENITEAAKYLANIIVSNGYHEDITRGNDTELLRWLAANPQYKKMLSELLSFADTGMGAFELQKRSDGYDVLSVHTKYNDEKSVGEANLSIKEESFGTRALFLIGCQILQALQTGATIFADEMDSGLHLSISRFIVDMFRNTRINSKNAQLILTTHDISLLDQNDIRKDQVWFTRKDQYGVSELYSLSDFEDVREETPFAKWYVNNKFGAMPSIESLEKLFVENGKSK